MAKKTLEDIREFVSEWDDARLKRVAETDEFNGYQDTYQKVINEVYTQRFGPKIGWEAVPEKAKTAGLVAEEKLAQKHIQNPIKWCYNKFGHIEVWRDAFEGKGESDLYLQVDTDVESFLKNLGIDPDDIFPGDCDVAEDPGYFE